VAIAPARISTPITGASLRKVAVTQATKLTKAPIDKSRSFTSITIIWSIVGARAAAYGLDGLFAVLGGIALVGLTTS
ncbi:hypothetical protein AB9F39_39555, partial [Rhizobium leguminosarum]